MRQFFISLILLALLAGAAQAAPVRYLLDRDRTEVAFTWYLGPDPVIGEIPVLDAELILDFDNVPASKVSVSLNAAQARAGFVFATQAMRGPKILDTANHPVIRFDSQAVRQEGVAAMVTGQMDVRGRALPATMKAELFRFADAPKDNLDHLVIIVTGTVSRSAFGADGWPDMVGDEITFRIKAHIDKATGS